MFRKLIVSGVALGLTAASTAALAEHDRYAPPGDGFDYARVLDVDPIVRQVRVSVPRQECWDESVPYSGGESPRAGGMILGGLIGGVLGHQIGSNHHDYHGHHGHGSETATVAGAVIGAAIGHDVAGRRAAATPGGYRTVERCETRYDEQVQERIDGYRVTYEYAGREYQTRLPYDPGEKLRVQVDVTPAGR